MTELVTAEDGQFEDVVVAGYGGAGMGGLDEAMVAQALETFTSAAAPAARKQLAPLLANLWEGTSHAQSGGDNLKLKFAGYCAMLEEYPADVAFEAIANWDRREKWWPARAELRADCDRLVNWRRVTAATLRRMA